MPGSERLEDRKYPSPEKLRDCPETPFLDWSAEPVVGVDVSQSLMEMHPQELVGFIRVEQHFNTIGDCQGSVASGSFQTNAGRGYFHV